MSCLTSPALLNVTSFSERKTAPSMSLPQVLVNPIHWKKTSTTSCLAFGSKFLLSKTGLLSESYDALFREIITAVTVFPFVLNCVPVPGTNVGLLVQRKVTGTCFPPLFVAPHHTPSLNQTSWWGFRSETKDQGHRSEPRRQTGMLPHRSAQPRVSDSFRWHIRSVSLERRLSTRDDWGLCLETLLVFTTGAVHLASSEPKRDTVRHSTVHAMGPSKELFCPNCL